MALRSPMVVLDELGREARASGYESQVHVAPYGMRRSDA